MAIQSLVLDPNAAPAETAPVDIRNETGGALAAGDLIYLSSWNEAQGRHLVSKADADVLGAHAVLIMQGALADVTDGQAYRSHRLTTLNTGAGAVGDPVYLDATTPGHQGHGAKHRGTAGRGNPYNSALDATIFENMGVGIRVVSSALGA